MYTCWKRGEEESKEGRGKGTINLASYPDLLDRPLDLRLASLHTLVVRHIACNMVVTAQFCPSITLDICLFSDALDNYKEQNEYTQS